MSYHVTPENYQLNAVSDTPDSRDLVYRPALIQLVDEKLPPQDLLVLDQGKEGACTGFGLAATINYLNQGKRKPTRVSARMLYEMARKFDEWDGVDYSGSSCRGAMRGWQNMGVCEDNCWPYEAEDNSELTAEQAANARNNTPGAYYRLSHRIEDFHAALNEVGILYVSANVHKGWYNENINEGVIPHHSDNIGGHAFAIVGYNAKGFYVQNSWGESWGDRGVALWTYEDWRQNISDGWVVRLAVSTPQLWGNKSFRNSNEASSQSEFSLFKSPKRHEIKGHFVHIDDGEFHTKGKYFSSLSDVKETRQVLDNSDNYKHILLYAHGGLNSPVASAERIAALKNTFRDNGIYPYHFMYDTGLLEELSDIVFKRSSDDGENRAEGFIDRFADSWDRTVENTTRAAGRAFWREMKRGAKSPFEPDGAGVETLKVLLKALRSDIKIHIVGHSTGAILSGYLLEALSEIEPSMRISSCSLMAPACTCNDYKNLFQPYVKSSPGHFGIDKMNVYNLSESLELDDTVTPAYRKSLLCLVSNAFEDKRGEALLGMETFCQAISQDGLEFIYSQPHAVSNLRTQSRTHGGFDGDVSTMNDILKTVTGSNELPVVHFTEKNLKY